MSGTVTDCATNDHITRRASLVWNSQVQTAVICQKTPLCPEQRQNFPIPGLCPPFLKLRKQLFQFCHIQISQRALRNWPLAQNVWQLNYFQSASSIAYCKQSQSWVIQRICISHQKSSSQFSKCIKLLWFCVPHIENWISRLVPIFWIQNFKSVQKSPKVHCTQCLELVD